MGRIGLITTLVSAAGLARARDGFDGERAGEERIIDGVRLCWCPPGTFTMGSPPGEPERRPGEDQVEVTLTRGFWAGTYEVTQGDWKRVVGKLAVPVRLPIAVRAGAALRPHRVQGRGGQAIVLAGVPRPLRSVERSARSRRSDGRRPGSPPR
jgi:hypothetical protein